MYVDVHSHLIHGIDDGPRKFSQTCEMLLAAHRDRISSIITTPHAEPGVAPFPHEAYIENLRAARAFCVEKKIPIKLYAGCEIMYTQSARRLLSDGELPTLAGGPYVLLEFCPHDSYANIQRAIREIGNAGYTPVIAHVERYLCLNKLDRLESLCEKYQCMVQVNAPSLIGGRGFQAMLTQRHIKSMLARGLVDLIATDSHNLTSRPSCMNEAYELLKKWHGESTARALCIQNPAEILSGEVN